jgi:hypothetical protein
MQDPLLSQLASRTRTFSRGSGISLNKIARLCGMEPSNFINFINGKTGLSAKATIKLYQLLSLSKHEVEMKLGKVATTSRVEHFQSLDSKPLRLDDSDTSSITDPSSDDSDDPDDIDFLKSQLGLYRSAIRQIKNYLNRPTKAKPNAGVTEGPRTVNTSPKAGGGSRGDEYPS